MRIAIAIGVYCALLAAAGSGPEVRVGYLGGSGTDDCDGITVDGAGDIYLACHSDSPDLLGAPHGGMDAVVAKIEGRTGKILWATRTGGNAWDAAGAVEVARDGSVYVLGQTESADFPTTPDAVQLRFGGPRRDVFVLKLDARGKIVYSTLLGGTKNDEPGGMAVAEDGTVYVGGVTMSDDFPGVHARYGPGGSPDGFIARLHPGDAGSLRTVLIGGKGIDHVTGVSLDREGNLFAAGFTRSADFPLNGALQARFGGEGDGFVVKLRAAEGSLLFSTYLGGAKLDAASGVALDAAGNPIVAGVTGSDDFVTTERAFQKRRRGVVDAFLTKLDKAGGRVLWSTYYGGSKENAYEYEGGSIEVDVQGQVWLDGMTNSTDLPTRNAYQASNSGGFDGFLAAFSPDGSELRYATYIGGSGHDGLEGLAIGKGWIYASGISASRGLASKGWHGQAAYGGGPYDALVLGLRLPIPAAK